MQNLDKEPSRIRQVALEEEIDGAGNTSLREVMGIPVVITDERYAGNCRYAVDEGGLLLIRNKGRVEGLVWTTHEEPTHVESVTRLRMPWDEITRLTGLSKFDVFYGSAGKIDQSDTYTGPHPNGRDESW